MGTLVGTPARLPLHMARRPAKSVQTVSDEDVASTRALPLPLNARRVLSDGISVRFNCPRARCLSLRRRTSPGLTARLCRAKLPVQQRKLIRKWLDTCTAGASCRLRARMGPRTWPAEILCALKLSFLCRFPWPLRILIQRSF